MSEYTDALDVLGLLVRAAAEVEIDVDMVQSHIARLDTLGPMLEPTAWMRGGAKNLEDQRELIELAVPFIRGARAFVDKRRNALVKAAEGHCRG